MSAAVEAGTLGIPSIGFSLLDYSLEADFEPTKKYIKLLVEQCITNGLPKGVVLNVNIPKLPENEIKGIRVCRQANAHWEEKFDKRTNPLGRDYYWLTGEFVNEDKGEDTDEWALSHGFVSVVPVQFDLTAHHAIQDINTWDI
jgi:5'-nucleotidase